MNDTFDELKTLLKRRAPKGFTVHSLYFEEDDHTSVPVPAHYAALRKLFGPWHLDIDPGDDPTTLWPRVTAHAAEMTKRYGFEVKVAEGRGNQIGYILLAGGRMNEAIEVFRANAVAYPESPNVYDSLGEAYEKAGNVEKARENYAQAVEKARAKRDPQLPLFQQNLDRITRNQASK